MILVTGATGTNGLELIRQLVDRGERVRALVRKPERAAQLFSTMDVDLSAGDLDDPASLGEAMRCGTLRRSFSCAQWTRARWSLRGT